MDSIQEAVRTGEASNSDKVIELLKSKSANLSSSFTINKQSADLSTSFTIKGKPFKSAIVNQNEIVSYIEDGYEVVRELKDGKFLIKKANGVHSVK